MDVAQSSLLLDPALVGLQNGISLVLATLEFQGLAPGVMTLDFDPAGILAVVGAGASPLLVQTSTASVTITPEPSLFALLVLGAVGIATCASPGFRSRPS